MKTIILSILLIGIITTSCSAQKKIAALSDNVITKAKLETYMIKKEKQKVTIENSNNKFANIKQSSPNLPINISLRPYYIKLDIQELTKICAKHINTNDLETLADVKYAGISIDLRTNTNGKVLEISFFTDGNSILSLQQIEGIEYDIKTSNIVNIKPEAEKYLKNSNFVLVDTAIYFDDILKVKKAL